MTKLFFILALFFTTNLSAQGNLQFNQAVIVNFSASLAVWTTATATTITVPPGKVWKIEHADVWIQATLRQTQQSEHSLFVDNILLRRYKGSTGTNHAYTDRLPVWLPAGTYSILISNEDATPWNYVGALNAIEFNVIP